VVVNCHTKERRQKYKKKREAIDAMVKEKSKSIK
jgi:hypothetical protein